MSDPSLELQGSLFNNLLADAGVTALVGNRIYDRVPQNTQFPYISIGEFQTVDDGAECVDGVEVFADLHVWSRSAGQVQAKQIASAIRRVIHDQAFPVAGFNLVDIRHRDTRFLQDPDGETTHGVITFRALIDNV